MRRPTLRDWLLALVLLGTAGVAADLALIEHYDSISQVLPFAVLALGLAGAAAAAYRPSGATVRALQVLMVVFVFTGLAGLWLHYEGNAAFESELYPNMTRLALVWSALRGATPTLAPGAFIQIGLLGLILCHGHPALRSRGEATDDEEEE